MPRPAAPPTTAIDPPSDVQRDPRPVVVMRRLLTPIVSFVQTEAKGGLLLLTATVIALIWANSSWGDGYRHLLHTPIRIDIGGRGLQLPLEGWINDGLMAIFFFVVGLEIKREVLAGELASPRQAALPIAGAIGGVVVPALLYALINRGSDTLHGWGIPMATDIAFALGILALLGRRVPLWLMVFLTALAIVDDLLAVLVIAAFYTDAIDWTWLAIAGGLMAVLVGLNLRDSRSPTAYLLVGGLLWYAMLRSGIHATIAGVLLGMSIPASPRKDRRRFVDDVQHALDRFKRGHSPGPHPVNRDQAAALHQIVRAVNDVDSPLHRIENSLHPWVSYAIMPVFALANAGVELPLDRVVDALVAPAGVGVVVGLVLGKPLGIAAASWLAVRLGIADLPTGARWTHLIGAAILGGVGFTMSLFVTGLAFDDPANVAVAKIAILAASTVAAVTGLLFLHRVLPRAGAES